MTNAQASEPIPAAVHDCRWLVVPKHTHAEFVVPHFWGLTKVKGALTVSSGFLDLRPCVGPAAELHLDATTVDTGHPKRDAHLRSPDFFDTASFPAVTFVAADIGDRRTASCASLAPSMPPHRRSTSTSAR